METTSIVSASGNERLMIQGLNEKKTDYVSNALHLQGLIDFNMTFTQEDTPYPADNNPEYIIARGSPKGSGTANMRGLSPKNYGLVYSVISSTSGIWFGDDLPVRFFGLSFDELITIDGVKSINRWVIFNCRATNLPDLSTKTVSESDPGHRDMPIALSAAPVFYDKADKTKGRAIFVVLNSKLHTAAFEMYENGIIMPTETIIQGGGV